MGLSGGGMGWDKMGSIRGMGWDEIRGMEEGRGNNNNSGLDRDQVGAYMI